MPEAHRCQSCPARGSRVCRVLTLMPDVAIGRESMIKRVPAGRMLVGQHNRTGWFGVIVSGVVKLTIGCEDGRQQIVGLQFPGDYMGCTGAAPSAVMAETATKVEICCFPQTYIEGLLGRNPALSRAVLDQAQSDLEAARRWMVVLGHCGALERVAALLLMFFRRLGPSARQHAVEADDLFELPLSRGELAEYLSLTIETVSRQIKVLKEMGAIDVVGRRGLRVLDPAPLVRLTGAEA